MKLQDVKQKRRYCLRLVALGIENENKRGFRVLVRLDKIYK